MELFKSKVKFPMKNSWVIILTLGLSSLLSYVYLDLPLAQWVQASPPFLLKIGSIVSELINPYPLAYLIVILFFIVRVLLKKEGLGNRILLMLITVSSMNALILPIKILFGRDRPELWFSKHLYGFEFFASRIAERSFPSGHAITIASILFSIACFYPRFFSLSILLSILLSFSRILDCKHYFSDTLVSIMISFFFTQWFYCRMKIAKIKF